MTDHRQCGQEVLGDVDETIGPVVVSDGIVGVLVCVPQKPHDSTHKVCAVDFDTRQKSMPEAL